jgi:hypothetical protein
MSTRSLESLRERLLRAGVAPRHVQRYLRELRDHYDDARRAELANGADADAAQLAAWARLGSDDSLAESVLARPELRSKGARFPALVFGAGPVLSWLALIVVTVALVRLLPTHSSEAKHAAAAAMPAWVFDAAQALCMLYMRGLPVVLGVIVFVMAARRRLRAHWPLAGAALVDVLAGTLTVQLLGATGIGVNSSLLPFVVPFLDSFGPRDLAAFADGLWRAAGMLAVSAAIYAAIDRLSSRRWAV